MAFFDNLSKTVSMASQGAVKKTKDVADIAKYTAQNTELKSRLNQEYQKLGEKYMQTFGASPDSALQQNVDRIRDIQEKLRENETRIKQLRGMVPCPHCGEMIVKDSAFCEKCGTRLIADDATVCPQCGKIVKAGIRFCTNCGTPMAQQGSGPDDMG